MQAKMKMEELELLLQLVLRKYLYKNTCNLSGEQSVLCTMPLVRPCEITIIGDEIIVSFILFKQKVKWRSWRRSPTSSSPEILT
jgi:hypothetical protein